jgi:hypothetical protein
MISRVKCKICGKILPVDEYLKQHHNVVHGECTNDSSKVQHEISQDVIKEKNAL